MSESEEKAYTQGERAVYVSLLNLCLEKLDYHDPQLTSFDWVIEREEAIQKLRSICADYGDNDWDEDLRLADILEKHLEDYLSGTASRVNEFLAYLINVKRENTNEWMMGLMDEINKLLDFTTDTDRIIYDTRSGRMKILKTPAR